ncbi:hypothetical protein [Rhodopirellula bahusiensis]|uniref:hypothetical protein n=1 Tax=Rhodopirellula bahusiensis TaxID=2014065 RepID=UPI003265DA23
MSNGTDLTPQQLHALAVAAKPAGKVRDKLVDGKKCRIDFTVRVHGELIVNNGTTHAGSSAAPSIDLLAGVLAEFGPRKRKAVVDAILKDRSEKGYKIDEAATEQAQRLIESTKTATTVKKRGAVTGKLNLELV